MLTAKEENNLKTYLGFALKKKAVFVGVKMEELLKKKKATYLFILSSCNEKKKEELTSFQNDNPKLIIYHYLGDYNIKEVLGYEKLNAFIITDNNLASAIKNTLEADK